MIRDKAIKIAAAVAVAMLAALVLAEARAAVNSAAYMPAVLRQPAPTPTPQPTATPTATRPANCDPAYPTVCIPPPPPNLDCPDVFPLVNFQVLPPDPHGFDRDKDGIGCEDP